MNDLDLAREKLAEGGCTFAAAKDGQVISSEKRGVAPLLDLLFPEGGTDAAPGSMRGWTCADKVCGKAPACLYVQLGVKEVYSHVMTSEARDIMERAGIICSFDVPADRIINRDGTDICPMEKAVMDIDDLDEAVSAIRIQGIIKED